MAILTRSGGGGAAGVSGLYDAYAYIRDQQTSGTAPGTPTSDTWTTRRLTTIVVNEESIVVQLASNEFRLAGGATYLIRGQQPFNSIDHNRSRLRNMDASTDLGIGAAEFCGSGTTNHSHVVAKVTLASDTDIALQYWVQLATANGLGLALGTGEVEVYAEVEVWRYAS